MVLRNTPIVPSLLSADFFSLSDSFALFEKYAISTIHIDIMDGHFVPPISIGYPVIQAIRKQGDYFFDAHLMVTNPEDHVTQSAAVGCNGFTFHIEAVRHVHRLIHAIKEQGMQAGIALLPKTPIAVLDHVIDAVDNVLLMLVDPGFGGQNIIPAMLPKLEMLSEYKKQNNLTFSIAVDGGVTPENALTLVEKGANALISGSSFFDHSVRKRFLRYIE